MNKYKATATQAVIELLTDLDPECIRSVTMAETGPGGVDVEEGEMLPRLATVSVTYEIAKGGYAPTDLKPNDISYK